MKWEVDGETEKKEAKKNGRRIGKNGFESSKQFFYVFLIYDIFVYRTRSRENESCGELDREGTYTANMKTSSSIFTDHLRPFKNGQTHFGIPRDIHTEAEPTIELRVCDEHVENVAKMCTECKLFISTGA